jgi:hypothetical protein
MDVVLRGKARLSKNSSSGGGSVMVGEMLRSLPYCVVIMVHYLFAARYMADSPELMVSWHTIIIVFLAKIRGPKRMDEHRGISLLDVFSKWYTSCLVLMLSEYPRPWSHCIVNYMGDGALGREYASSVFQLLLNKSAEWSNIIPVSIFECDVTAAYDNLHPRLVAAALHNFKVHPWLIASILHVMTELSIVPTFHDLDPDDPIFKNLVLNKCIRQGGVESGILWRICICFVLTRVVQSWHARGLGMTIGDVTLSNLLWVDNIWLVASNDSDLHDMAGELTSALHFWNLDVKREASQYLTTGKQNFFSVRFGFEQVMVSCVKHMKILGTLVGAKSLMDLDPFSRMKAATKAFFAESCFYLCKDIPMVRKLERFCKNVIPCVTYGSCSWSISQLLMDKIHAWENGLLRKIRGFSIRKDETWVEGYKRSTRDAREAFFKTGCTSSNEIILRKILKVALAEPLPLTHHMHMFS